MPTSTDDNGHGPQLWSAVSEQLDRLMACVAALDADTAGRACVGREKLGDGTVGAIAQHTADNYERIAGFVAGEHGVGEQVAGGHGAHGPGAHGPGAHRPGTHGPGPGGHGSYSAATLEKARVLDQLGAARRRLALLAGASDAELARIPPKDSFRFCDGQRTLDEVLSALVLHQSHQVDAIEAAVPIS